MTLGASEELRATHGREIPSNGLAVCVGDLSLRPALEPWPGARGGRDRAAAARRSWPPAAASVPGKELGEVT